MGSKTPTAYNIGLFKDPEFKNKQVSLENHEYIPEDVVNFMFITYLEDKTQRSKCIEGFVQSHGVLPERKQVKDINHLTFKIFGDNNTLTQVSKYISIPHAVDEVLNCIVFKDTNILDFLYTYKSTYLYPLFVKEYINYPINPPINPPSDQLPVCLFSKDRPDAITPTKARFSDVGYDLSIVDIEKVINDTTIRYNTGIHLSIPFGYYAEVVPRSSLAKSGYMLSNSVGIVDRGYRGEILVALTKVSSKASVIEFPFKCCQIVFKKQEFVNMVNVDSVDNNTDRGCGGYGSTG